MSFARNRDVELYYETFGARGDPALLLINGLGSQCINYQEEWCEKFAAEGFFVIRFDNRDVGLSSKLIDKFFTGTAVNVALGTNPSGGTLLWNGSPASEVTASLVNGVVTFTGFGIDKAGTGYTLTASTLGLTAISTPFNIR